MVETMQAPEVSKPDEKKKKDWAVSTFAQKNFPRL